MYAQSGCPSGNCFRSHVNETEVELALAVSKAPFPYSSRSKTLTDVSIIVQSPKQVFIPTRSWWVSRVTGDRSKWPKRAAPDQTAFSPARMELRAQSQDGVLELVVISQTLKSKRSSSVGVILSRPGMMTRRPRTTWSTMVSKFLLLLCLSSATSDQRPNCIVLRVELHRS